MSLRHWSLEMQIRLLGQWDYSLARYWSSQIRSLVMVWSSPARWSYIFFSWITFIDSFENLLIINSSNASFLLCLWSIRAIATGLRNLLLLRVNYISCSFRTLWVWRTCSILAILSTRHSSYMFSEVLMKWRPLRLISSQWVSLQHQCFSWPLSFFRYPLSSAATRPLLRWLLVALPDLLLRWLLGMCSMMLIIIALFIIIQLFLLEGLLFVITFTWLHIELLCQLFDWLACFWCRLLLRFLLYIVFTKNLFINFIFVIAWLSNQIW